VTSPSHDARWRGIASHTRITLHEEQLMLQVWNGSLVSSNFHFIAGYWPRFSHPRPFRGRRRGVSSFSAYRSPETQHGSGPHAWQKAQRSDGRQENGANTTEPSAACKAIRGDNRRDEQHQDAIRMYKVRPLRQVQRQARVSRAGERRLAGENAEVLYSRY
jgi:hypothetical protein